MYPVVRIAIVVIFRLRSSRGWDYTSDLLACPRNNNNNNNNNNNSNNNNNNGDDGDKNNNQYFNRLTWSDIISLISIKDLKSYLITIVKVKI